MRRLLLQTFLVLVAAFAIAWAAIIVMKPGPAGKIVIASGGAGGLYNDLATAYKKELEHFGVDVELRPAVEGGETLKGLFPQFISEFKTYDPKNMDLGAGFIKGGFSGSLRGRLASEKEQVWHKRQTDNLMSVGRLFYEPLWVFYSGSEPLTSLRQLRGKTLYVGTRVSGTRRVVLQLLKANGVTDKNTTFIDEVMPGDASPLTSHTADAALLIVPPETPLIQELLRNKQIRLMDFSSQADAYTNRFPSLSRITLHQGAVEFDPDIPSADVTLLATSAALIVRKDLDPSLVSLLTYAVMHNPKPGFDASGEPILFYKAGEFPSGNDPEFELAPQAAAVYKTGDLPFLLRAIAPLTAQLGLPFWPAAVINEHATKSILLLIPLLSILIPMIRILPAIYNWRVRRRLLYWYKQLKALENSIQEKPTAEELATKQAEIERIDAAVSRIWVPIYFSDQLYDLRGHIDLIRQRIAPRGAFRVAGQLAAAE